MGSWTEKMPERSKYNQMDDTVETILIQKCLTYDVENSNWTD